MLLKRVVAVCVCIFAVACKSEPAKPKVEPVAKVNGEPIGKTEFDAHVARNLQRYRGQGRQLPPGIEHRIKESVLRRMIDDVVVAQKAKELGIAISPKLIDERFQEHKARFRTDSAFELYLERSNNTAENMRDDLARNMLRDHVVDKLAGAVEIKDEEVAEYYEENKARFVDKEQIRASRILLRATPEAKGDVMAAAKKKAQAARKEALGKDADFDAVARKHSQGPEAGRGGDLGWFSRGRMPPEFDEVAFALEPGKISKVVKTKLGFEVIKVLEKKPERQRSFEQVKENINNSLSARRRNEKRREVLRELNSKAQVEKLVKFDPKQGQAQAQNAGAPGREIAPGGPSDTSRAKQLRPEPGAKEGEGSQAAIADQAEPGAGTAAQ